MPSTVALRAAVLPCRRQNLRERGGGRQPPLHWGRVNTCHSLNPLIKFFRCVWALIAFSPCSLRLHQLPTHQLKGVTSNLLVFFENDSAPIEVKSSPLCTHIGWSIRELVIRKLGLDQVTECGNHFEMHVRQACCAKRRPIKPECKTELFSKAPPPHSGRSGGGSEVTWVAI